MEWLGVWNCIFSGSEFQISEPEIWQKFALSAEFRGFSCKLRPLKNIFRTLENGDSIRHQSIPPLSAGRERGRLNEGAGAVVFPRADYHPRTTGIPRHPPPPQNGRNTTTPPPSPPNLCPTYVGGGGEGGSWHCHGIRP